LVIVYITSQKTNVAMIFHTQAIDVSDVGLPRMAHARRVPHGIATYGDVGVIPPLVIMYPRIVSTDVDGFICKI
jgi:hypothetical protein